jgi:N-acetylmuramoyl-L-alanine amidase-like protein
MSTREDTDTDVDLEALLNSPEETGDYDCTVPDEFAGEPEEDLEGRSQPIDAACSRQYTAVRQSGTRSLSQIGLIVIHCTQSNSARSSAQWFVNTRAQGSAHLVVDDVECFRTLDSNIIPWGAKGANTRGFHIEIAGFAQWSKQDWMKHSQALRRAAYKAAVHAVKFGIPIRMLTAQQLKAGHKGFVTHALCTKAFGGSHTDPGSHCPTEQLMAWAKEYADQL